MADGRKSGKRGEGGVTRGHSECGLTCSLLLGSSLLGSTVVTGAWTWAGLSSQRPLGEEREVGLQVEPGAKSVYRWSREVPRPGWCPEWRGSPHSAPGRSPPCKGLPTCGALLLCWDRTGLCPPVTSHRAECRGVLDGWEQRTSKPVPHLRH